MEKTMIAARLINQSHVELLFAIDGSDGKDGESGKIDGI
jgi:hypothetical protein